jgi:hypothetical protein
MEDFVMKRISLLILCMVFVFSMSTCFASFLDGDYWAPVTFQSNSFIDSRNIQRIPNTNTYNVRVKSFLTDDQKEKWAKSFHDSLGYYIHEYSLNNETMNMTLKSSTLYDINNKPLYKNLENKEYKVLPEELYAQIKAYYVLDRSIWQDLGYKGSSRVWLEIGNVERLKNTDDEVYHYWFKMQPMDHPELYILVYDEANITKNTYKSIYRVIFNQVHIAKSVQLPHNEPRYDKSYVDSVKDLLRKYADR